MGLLVISDVNIVPVSCNKIQVIEWKYHYTVIIKNKDTICNLHKTTHKEDLT